VRDHAKHATTLCGCIGRVRSRGRRGRAHASMNCASACCAWKRGPGGAPVGMLQERYEQLNRARTRERGDPWPCHGAHLVECSVR
jgi:hypothetical protein